MCTSRLTLAHRRVISMKNSMRCVFFLSWSPSKWFARINLGGSPRRTRRDTKESSHAHTIETEGRLRRADIQQFVPNGSRSSQDGSKWVESKRYQISADTGRLRCVSKERTCSVTAQHLMMMMMMMTREMGFEKIARMVRRVRRVRIQLGAFFEKFGWVLFRPRRSSFDGTCSADRQSPGGAPPQYDRLGYVVA